MTDSNPVTAPLYSKTQPFFASLKVRERLTREDSLKNTQHIVLDLSGSGISYNVGDSLGIQPIHDEGLVERTRKAMRVDGTELITVKKTGKVVTIHEFLTKKANISTVSRRLLQEIAHRQSHPAKKAMLNALFEEGQRDALADYIHTRELWDLLGDHSEVTFGLQELCDFLMPLLPRLYSISSSMKAVGDEVHLTVALLEYHTHGHHRRGVCTHYLCNLVGLGDPRIPVYVQPHHGFTVPSDPDAAMIMIGPGTGVAPFRAFMQERMARGCTGKNWLFFGEWTRSNEFFYEDYWNQLVSKGVLRLDTAFSRDQAHKIYVQNRMLECAAELWRWLQEGAYFYVCGDAEKMAKDVDAALHQIAREQGGLDEDGAKQFVKKLRADKRYLRDIY